MSDDDVATLMAKTARLMESQPTPQQVLDAIVHAASTTVPGFELMPAFGWVGPANIPADVVKKLTDELVAVGKIPEVRVAMEKFGVLQTELPGQAYAEALAKEREWRYPSARAFGIALNQAAQRR